MKDLFQYEEIRALFWKQPFATLMFYGKIETRKWDTAYRGKVLICTSLETYKDHHLAHMCTYDQKKAIAGIEYQERRRTSLTFGQQSTMDLRGYAIGIATLADVRPMVMQDAAQAYVAFQEQLYAHVYADVKRIHPFPLKGFQGLRRITQEVKDKIKVL